MTHVKIVFWLKFCLRLSYLPRMLHVPLISQSTWST